MMDLAQIEEVFSDNQISAGSVKMAFLITIGEYVPYTLKIDENNLDYYYSINVIDMTYSPHIEEIIYLLKDDGWALTEDKEELVKYIDYSTLNNSTKHIFNLKI